jgi:hypothetical protein
MHVAECSDAIYEDVPILNALHCADGGDPADDAACLELAELEISFHFGCHDFVVFDDEDPYRAYREAAEHDMALWRRVGEPRATRGRRLPGNLEELFRLILYEYRTAHDDDAGRRALATARRYGFAGPRLERASRHLE